MIEQKEKIDQIISKFAGKKGTLIPLLQEVQHIFGYLPKDVIKYIAQETRNRVAEIYGVATFYSMFRLKPQGKNIIRVCKGTACHVSGANSILDTIKDELKLSEDDDTTDDAKFTVMEVACLGCCSLAPVIMINEDTHGKLTPDKTRAILKKY